jgi:hypothetical protein
MAVVVAGGEAAIVAEIVATAETAGKLAQQIGPLAVKHPKSAS